MHPIVILSLICGALAVLCIPWFLWERHLYRIEPARRAEDRRVMAGPAAIAAQPGTLYRPVHIERSPLARRHGVDVYARTSPGYKARHAAVGPRDPLMAARIEKTGVFDIAELHALLDAELVLVEPVRTVTGPGEWSQPTLTLRGVVGYGEVR